MRHAFLCAFLCRRCTTTTWKCLFSRFLEELNTKRRFSKSFEKIVELSSRKTHQIENLIKRHGIRDTNFKTVRIHFLRDVFSHVVVVVASHVWCHNQTLDKRNYSRSNYLSSEHFIDRAECLFMWWFSFRFHSQCFLVPFPLSGNATTWKGNALRTRLFLEGTFFLRMRC